MDEAHEGRGLNRAAAADELDRARVALQGSAAYRAAAGVDERRLAIVLNGLGFAGELARELSIDPARARVLAAMLLNVFTATEKTRRVRAVNPLRYEETALGRCETSIGRALDLLAAAPPEPEPEPEPEPDAHPATAVFGRLGAFVDNVSAFTFGPAVELGGLQWVAPQISNGTVLRRENISELNLIRPAYAAAGLEVAPWVVCYREPEQEAARTVEALGLLDGPIVGLVVNGEADWIGSDRPARYVTALRQLLGRELPPILWSVLGGAVGSNVYPLPYPVMVSLGDFAPQCYPGITELKYPGRTPTDYSVTHSVECYARAGIPVERQHPTLGLDPEDRGSYTLGRFADELGASGARSLNVYLGELVTREEWVALAAIARRLR